MSRTYPIPSALPTDKAVGFIANLFRSTACIEKAFHQEGGELQYLEECWSDSAVLQFILLGWIGIALKIMLLILLATILGACIQGRRPWFVFVSCVKGVGRIVRGIFWCFEIDDHMSGRESAGETEKGLGIVWQEEKEGGGYFGSPKEKVLSKGLECDLTNVLTLFQGVIQQEKRGRRPEVGGGNPHKHRRDGEE